MKINKLVFLLVFLILLGCETVPVFNVNINSISGSNLNIKNKYFLIPGLKDVNKDDLQFQEFARYVEKALWRKGYVKAASFNEADIAIFMSYGLGEPQVQQYSYSVPTWGQTGVSAAKTFGTLNTYGNSASYNATTTYTPTYGVTGATTQIGTAVTYSRYLELEALDVAEYKKSNAQKQVWKTMVTSTGSSSDLRQVMPVMVAASSEYIDSNTGKIVAVSLQETDKKVLDLKQ
jgi:hypothetical protein